MLSEGTTILGIILATDKTHLTNSTGDRKMHPIYISLGNISKDIQWKRHACAWLLLAIIPICKFSETTFSGSRTKQEALPGILSQPLFHVCMRRIFEPMRLDRRQSRVVPSPDGHSRLCVAILMAWIADPEEQLLIRECFILPSPKEAKSIVGAEENVYREG
jgi:hypothetical protein